MGVNDGSYFYHFFILIFGIIIFMSVKNKGKSIQEQAKSGFVNETHLRIQNGVHLEKIAERMEIQNKLLERQNELLEEQNRLLQQNNLSK